MLTVSCVLKTGGEFTWDHVRILHDSVARHWPKDVPYRFMPLANERMSIYPAMQMGFDLPGWWSKMELFRDWVLDHLCDADGKNPSFGVLYFDLDTAITGSLADIAHYCLPAFPRGDRAPFTILRDFYRHNGYGSGMMFIPNRYYLENDVWADFHSRAEEVMAKCIGDQNYLEVAIPGASLWQDAVPGQIESFKPAPMAGATLGSLPKNVRVICFHGEPRPWQTPKDHWIRAHWHPSYRFKTDEDGNVMRENFDQMMGTEGVGVVSI